MAPPTTAVTVPADGVTKPANCPGGSVMVCRVVPRNTRVTVTVAAPRFDTENTNAVGELEHRPRSTIVVTPVAAAMRVGAAVVVVAGSDVDEVVTSVEVVASTDDEGSWGSEVASFSTVVSGADVGEPSGVVVTSPDDVGGSAGASGESSDATASSIDDVGSATTAGGGSSSAASPSLSTSPHDITTTPAPTSTDTNLPTRMSTLPRSPATQRTSLARGVFTIERAQTRSGRRSVHVRS